MLHGGGYSALTWAEFTVGIIIINYIKSKIIPISYMFQKSLMTMVVCKVMAIDLRGHGDTQTSNEEDLSADTLAE